MTRMEQGDIDAFTRSLRMQGTPWALGCEALILNLWREARLARSEKGQITQAAGESADVPQFASGMESSLAGERPAQNFQFDKEETPQTDAMCRDFLVDPHSAIAVRFRELELALRKARCDAEVWLTAWEQRQKEALSATLPIDAVIQAVRSVPVGNSAVRKTVIEQAVEAIEALLSSNIGGIVVSPAMLDVLVCVAQSQRGDQALSATALFHLSEAEKLLSLYVGEKP